MNKLCAKLLSMRWQVVRKMLLLSKDLRLFFSKGLKAYIFSSMLNFKQNIMASTEKRKEQW